MADRPQQAADVISGLTGATPNEARQALDEFSVKDQVAALAVSGGGGGSSLFSLLGPYRVAFDTVGITGRHQVGPELANGSAVLIAYAVPTASNGGLWEGASGNVTLTIGMEDGGDWDEMIAYTVNNGAYATLPTEYQQGVGVGGDGLNTHYRRVGVVRTGTGHIWVTAVDGSLNAPTIGEADIYALVYTPA